MSTVIARDEANRNALVARWPGVRAGLRTGGSLGTATDLTTGAAVSPRFMCELSARITHPDRAVVFLRSTPEAEDPSEAVLGPVFMAVRSALKSALGDALNRGTSMRELLDPSRAKAELATATAAPAAALLQDYGLEVVSIDMITLTLSDDDMALLGPSVGDAAIVGARVKAQWTDGRYYLATIAECRGDECLARWDDGSPPLWLRRDQIRTGRFVQAEWTNGKYYRATITAVNGTSSEVTWDDGSPPTWLEPEKIRD